MDFSDERLIAAPSATVWAAILDPEVLKECIPGCSALSGTPEDGFEATVTTKVGPVKATFKGAVTLSDIVEGESVTLSGEGKGGAAGFAKGGARVQLTPETGEDGGEATRLAYTVEARVGGKIAQLGSRLIDGFAKKMANDFFSRFQQAVEPAVEEDETAEAEAAADGGEPARKQGWFRRLVGKAAT